MSLQFYGGQISNHQRAVARRTRTLIESSIGRYTYLRSLVGGSARASAIEMRRAQNLVTRALNLQWVLGNADVAETSFFKINSQGTPLDDVEEMLLRNRTKAIAIAARAIFRSGSGHKYWARFSPRTQTTIERLAEKFGELLFDPEVQSPIKTLDLPLGGPVSPVDALALLIDFLAIASSKSATTRNIRTDPEDADGSGTVEVLQSSQTVAERISGNDSPSLGLHPAVYFYNDRGVYQRHLFLGVTRLITDKIRNNDDSWFRRFTKVRGKLEKYLIDNKTIINQIFANVNREARVLKVRDMMNALVTTLSATQSFGNAELFASIGFSGTILDIGPTTARGRFSRDTRSQVFIREALPLTPKCPYCHGLLFALRSISYDHKTPRSAGGESTAANAQLMHPYCNSLKGNQTP